MKQVKLLIIGPLPEPTTGLSLSNKIVFEGLHQRINFSVSKINTSLPSFEESVGVFSLKKSLFFLKLNFKAYKVLRHKVVYITIGQSFFGVLKYAVYILLAKAFNKEIIIHLHGNNLIYTYNTISRFKQKLLRFILSKTSKAIVLSKTLKANFIPFLEPSKIFVLTNFVEEYLYLSEDEKHHKDYNSLKIVYLSNLMTEKGILYFFEALNELNKRGVKFEAKCAGHIDKNIETLILEKMNQIKNLTYLGIVKNEEKRKLLKWSNVFVFPSYLIEGLPLSILEAMVTGNIIISTKHDALTDNFNTSNIHFVKKQSSKDLVEKLINLNENLSGHHHSINLNYEFTDKLNEHNFVNNLSKIIYHN